MVPPGGSGRLYFDGEMGVIGDVQPWKDGCRYFVQMQFPLIQAVFSVARTHSDSLMGLVIAMLSVTGVYIWWKNHVVASNWSGVCSSYQCCNNLKLVERLCASASVRYDYAALFALWGLRNLTQNFPP